MTSTILNYWPFKEKKPRISQEQLLYWMESLPDHIKYVIAEAPVGTGKSAVGVNYSAFLNENAGNSLILTPQKILQKQYEDSFSSTQLFSLYGKSNYSCQPKETNCDIGSDLKPRCEQCPYKAAYGAARSAPNTVLNYTLALILMSSREDQKLTKRKLVVCDEAHTLEHHLTEFNALQIGERRFKQFKVEPFIPSNESNAIAWIRSTYKPAIEKELAVLRPLITAIEDRYLTGDKMDKADSEIINRYKDVVHHLEIIDTYLDYDLAYLVSNFVLVKDQTSFKFKSLYGSTTFKNTIDKAGDKILFISSTILNKDEFCKDLGLDIDKSAFISIDSEFPIENRPIVYLPITKMNYGWDKPDRTKDRSKLIKAMIEILSIHSTESGIIHSGSFQVAQWLIDQLEGKIPHKIFHHIPKSGITRDKAIDNYINNTSIEPSLLISPSITEGLDLYDDRGRFAIFAKTPYPNLGDSWIKRRADISNEWYRRQAMISVIQGTGRVVRSSSDTGNSYILDETFGQLYKSLKKKLPKWFVDSVQE